MSEQSKIFERIACKIVEKLLSKKVLYSGMTKETRDGGIDSVIRTENELVTVEAKLRLAADALGLKDIASSVVFYLLRMNDKHYIVTNVHIAKDTLQVIEKINAKEFCHIYCIDGKETIAAINEISRSLNKDEEKLAKLLLNKSLAHNSKEHNNNKQTNSTPSINLSKSQITLYDKIRNELHNKKKCIMLSGKIGTGKSTVANAVATATSPECSTIVIDCQRYNTIELFMYQFSNILIGIDIADLVREYTTISLSSSEYELKSTTTNEIEILAQALKGEQYLDNIAFVAQKYIDNVISRFSFGSICCVIDNYSAATQKLDKFISSYIINSSEKIQFLIVTDTDEGSCENTELTKISHLPMNISTFKCIKADTLTDKDTFDFVDILYKNIPHKCKNELYRYFGGNMLLIKMALDEMEKSKNYDVASLRPYTIEDIYIDRIAKFTSENKLLSQALFICWVFNGRLALSVFPFFLDQDVKKELQATGFFNDNNGELFICNICLFRVISKYYIENYNLLRKSLAELILSVSEEKLNGIAAVRTAFFVGSDRLAEIAKREIISFDNKLEHTNIIESRWLLYLAAREKCNDTLLAEAEANLLYELIDFDINSNEIDITPIADSLGRYCSSIAMPFIFCGADEAEKSKLSEIRLKYALWSYFICKRKNDYKNAVVALQSLETYISCCQNDVLVSKIIRFNAICCKELGNRAGFFELLEKGVEDFPENAYLKATLSANRAAGIDKSRRRDAYKMLVDEALPAAKKSNEKYLYLWLLNDKLIYALEIGQKENIIDFDFNSEYNTILNLAERLCAVTDKARADNTRGAFLLTQKASEFDIYECFREAFYGISQCETNDIMFYFGVNYLHFIPRSNEAEFEKVSNILLDWCIFNKEKIKKKTEKIPIFDKPSNKLIVALYSFSEALKGRAANKHKCLVELEQLSKLLIDGASISKQMYFGDKPIVLF